MISASKFLMSITHIAEPQIQKATHQNGCHLWLFYTKKDKPVNEKQVAYKWFQ